MERECFERLEEVMGLMAAGDRAAVFTLYEEFGATIGAALRRQLHAIGVDRVRPDDIEGLIIDACLEIQACAGAWSPDGGALPWNWAERRLRGLVSRFIGVRADALDDERADAVEPVGVASVGNSGLRDPEEVEVLAGLAAIDADCALLRDALARVASDRDRALLLELKVQAGLGDPSPALTVAERHSMRPDAVRQAVKRTLDRLRHLARTDGRYAALGELALLA
ncbi:MAG TPA: hypothetical protein VF711_10390 [Acidimicrobiales bacterium]